MPPVRPIQLARPAHMVRARPKLSQRVFILRASRTAGGPSRFEGHMTKSRRRTTGSVVPALSRVLPSRTAHVSLESDTPSAQLSVKMIEPRHRRTSSVATRIDRRRRSVRQPVGTFRFKSDLRNHCVRPWSYGCAMVTQITLTQARASGLHATRTWSRSSLRSDNDMSPLPERRIA